jgi:hypothetical protein
VTIYSIICYLKSDTRKREDFFTSTRSTFSEFILYAGHEIRPMEETVTILHFENCPKGIEALEEIEIIKATTFDHMLNIMQNNTPLYKVL